MSDFITLGIESSCDDTSVAVVANGTKILSNQISSQLDEHARFGGVVPELAARCHLESLVPLYRRAMEEAGITLDQVDLVAVTYGPGLVGSLLVGLSFAKGLALSRGLPLVGVNHIEGHIYANLLEHPEIEPPLLCLTVSGGHTDLLYIEAWGRYRILGRTLDDAAGEAFDKVARVLGLGYPGGPVIDRLAREGKPDIEFPQVKSLADPDSYHFSFSGLKTAVINWIHRHKQTGEPVDVPQVAASFQANLVNQLVRQLEKAIRAFPVRAVLLSGGVASNSLLRQRCAELTHKEGLALYYPSPRLCTDNAAMIAAAGYYNYHSRGKSSLRITADPNLKL
ncbi:MAG TPA: tRNA (adenosine(37)-N6)-threonylcarbamoyltransferase complex transferase subunit TsaD [Bacillota bacterium]|nr:tRNA (adenosine(37)-N6)-threonylcarbamoyltransferase complex transferase subunit TsaD [Bacillota bacterium]HPT86466.1 tRNA (adenosine(37)-N6)-threonylcarbamoyltransferase complex transferase subunit TsaD [Bacillota bacterium]